MNSGPNNPASPNNGEPLHGQQVPPQHQYNQPHNGQAPHGQVQPNGYVQNGQYFQGQPPVQPPAPENKKNWFARHKILTGVLGVIAAITVISALGGGGDSEPTPEASSPAAATDSSKSSEESAPAEDEATEEKEEPTQEPKEEAEVAEPAVAFKIGDVADAGDMTYKVKSVKTASTVGPDFLEEKAKGKYVVVALDVTNNSNESVLVSSSFFKLKSGDKTFEADSMASFSANSDEDVDNFLGEELNPDLSMTGYIVFDVSEKVAKAKDNIFQAQTGFWGTETVDILLSK